MGEVEVRNLKYDIDRKDVGQIVIGTGSGFCAGFFGTRIGQIVAFAVFAGIVLFQIANYNGLFTVDWNKVDKYSDCVEKTVKEEGPSWLASVADFAVENMFMTIGFLGGAIVGVSCA